MFFSHKLTLQSILVSLLMTGCGTTQQQANTLAQDASLQVELAKQKAALSTPVVTSTPAAWLMGETIKVETLPAVLTQKVSYRPSHKVSLSDVATWITQTTGLSVNTAEIEHHSSSNSAMPAAGTGVLPGVLMPPPAQLMDTQSPTMWIAYEGRLSGLLDLLGNKSGSWWKIINDGPIHFYRLITKTIYLPALERKSTGSSSIVSSSGTSGGTNTAGTNNSGTATNSNEYSVYVWSDIEKAAKTVAGSGSGASAQVIVSPALGSLTVTGTPIQVRNVEEWARNLADNLSQQVAITLSMYSVNVNNAENYQWDPTVIYKNMSTSLGVSITGLQMPSIQSSNTPLNLSVGLLDNGKSNFSGSSLALQALSTLGTVSNLYQNTIVTQNGQPAPMQIGKNITYVASSSTTQTVNVGSTESLTPGYLTTGITAMFMPRIVNGKVLLSMNLTNSALDGPIATFSSPNGTASIQTPILDTNTSQQMVSLTPGDALLLTGMQQDNGQINQSGVGPASNWLLGGGLGSSTGKKIIAIVVTAKVY